MTTGRREAHGWNSEVLRVLVVSDVRLLQEGLSSVLAHQDGVSVIGTADVTSARARTAELRPDIVLFDATKRGSVDHARDLAASAPEAKIVAFGVPDASNEILALAAAGTAGYIPDDAEAKDVLGVLDRVMHDELVCSPRATASLYREVATLSSHGCSGAEWDGVLSKRELQIAHLIHSGLSNKQIARELGIAATTVKNHVHNIFDKLKVHRRTEAAAWLRANLRSLASSLASVSKAARSGRKAL